MYLTNRMADSVAVRGPVLDIPVCTCIFTSGHPTCSGNWDTEASDMVTLSLKTVPETPTKSQSKLIVLRKQPDYGLKH